MKITRELLRKWNACYDDQRIAELVPEAGLTPLEVAALDIPAHDRLWVLLREDILPEGTLRILACRWAMRACDEAGWTDTRSLNAIDMAERHALGEATDADLAAARDEAWAAWAAAQEAAREAAREGQIADVVAELEKEPRP